MSAVLFLQENTYVTFTQTPNTDTVTGVSHDLMTDTEAPFTQTLSTNAVNGVINIITKEARKTKGTYLSSIAGTAINNI